MSEWLDIMLGEIDRRRHEDEDDLQEAARRAADTQDKDTDTVAQE